MISKIQRMLRLKPYYLIFVIFLLVLGLLALLAPLFPFDPVATDIPNRLQAPQWAHPFGTDELGRDYFSRILYGARVSLLVGLASMVMATLIGSLIGFLSAYIGGRLDAVLMRLIDLISSVPSLVLTTVLAALLKPGLFTIIIIIAFFTWMSIARLVRAETLSLKERDYVKYAQFLGFKPLTIIRRHILPQVIPTIIVGATSVVASAIMMESTLSFLGLGIQPPESSWGSLLQNAQSYLQLAPYMAVLPGVLIILTIISFNGLGNLIRDSYDLEER
ncbi:MULTISPECIES: ABC transporter permease [Aerococcus]|uniref:ABC transporter permease n=1 Tax=Aerococcus sanguinicola TaxID=119206 RepID=A0A5N1GI54_9LACT|nr:MULTISPECIES: ABC transporter permease [Aerococcus]KAA9300635.1 ABC transporter permease [Aerococcus sanguinicola]MDK6370122.1 ABC transporter permease [Aerococcus sp. UMB9870]MDK6680067.1 ABC transporter permease [Aerococcus sp. UMB8608]MDK6686228.1 ABC transporter permease [Aerococcus sp. UMB8623]MDK6939956.1 ABC transporter permease [Aerococcus sp. UMB8487]